MHATREERAARGRKIASLMGSGLTLKVASDRLGISPSTARHDLELIGAKPTYERPGHGGGRRPKRQTGPTADALLAAWGK